MRTKLGLGILILTGMALAPVGHANAFTAAGPAIQDDGEMLTVQQMSDEELNKHMESLSAALESGDQRALRGAMSGAGLIARGLSSNRAISDAQVEKLVANAEELKEKYPDHADQFEQYLFTVENLTIGRMAPNIKGVDTDEVEFELSEYKGKVVVIDFWGDW